MTAPHAAVGMGWWNIISLWQARFSRHGSGGPPPCRQAALIPNGAAQKTGSPYAPDLPFFDAPQVPPRGRLRDSASGAGVPDDHVKLVKLQHRTRAAAQEIKGKTLAFLFVVKGKGPFQAFPPVQQRQCGQGNIRLVRGK